MAFRFRWLGWLFLLGGCVAHAFFFVEVSNFTHSQWIWHSQNLPEGETILRMDAISSLRDFQLKANWIFRSLILVPTVSMFIGGLILGIGSEENNQKE